MKDYGFFLNGSQKYTFSIEDEKIMLFPNEDRYIFAPDFKKGSWLEMVGRPGTRGAVWQHKALIEHVQEYNNQSILIKSKYLLSYWDTNCVGGFDIVGEVIDDLLFFDKEPSWKIDEFHYDPSEPHCYGEWKFSYKEREVSFSVNFANVLSWEGRDKYEFRPFIRVLLSGEEDIELICELFEITLNFIRLIRYRYPVGKCSVKLLDNQGQRIGTMQADENDTPLVRRYPIAPLSFWETIIPQILKLVLQDTALNLSFLPTESIRRTHLDYDASTISKLFTTFEIECHKNRTLFETVDSQPIEAIKEKIETCLNEIKRTDLSDEERRFVSEIIEDVERHGTSYGQKKKIQNAYNILSTYIDEIIRFSLLCETEISSQNEYIKQQLKKIPGIRAKIVHHGNHDSISEKDAFAVYILEVMVYTQILVRSGLDQKAISEILSFNLEKKPGNYTYLIPD